MSLSQRAIEWMRGTHKIQDQPRETMADTSDLESEYESLLQLLYLCPFAVARIDERGDILMMNSMGAQLMMQFAPSPVLENLFTVFGAVAPDLRAMVAAFAPQQGPICEGHRVDVGLRGKRTVPLVLSLTLIKLAPGSIMVAVSDISRIEAANREKGVLLSNISDGLVTLDREGRMSGERSAALTQWLGQGQPGQTFWDYLLPTDPKTAVQFEMGWQALADGFLPLELCLVQMPRRIQAGEVMLSISYKSMYDDGALSQVMLVIRDMTSELERDRLEGDQRELMAAVDRLARDRVAFRDFMQEGTALVRGVVQDGSTGGPTLARTVHTLKGTSGVFGLFSIAALCHQIEDYMKEHGGVIAEADLKRLQGRWAQLSHRFGALLGEAGTNIEITTDEHRRLLAAIRGGMQRQQLEDLVSSWRYQSVQSQLERFADQIRDLAQRMNKGAVEVITVSPGLRHPRERFAAFWGAFTHAVRNTVDHGVDSPKERQELSKPPIPRVALRALLSNGLLQIEIEDDGRGIDWQKVGQKARAQGLPAETRDDLVKALFSDGISTRDEVTETSGRGVGMSALQAACEALGGQIEVQSATGAGTRMRFSFPAELIAPPRQAPPAGQEQPGPGAAAKLSIPPQSSIPPFGKMPS